MWDIVTWHNGTLSMAWWFLIVLFLLASIIGGSKAAGRR